MFASVDPRNLVCLELLEKVGLRQEAHFRESLWLGDGWVDDVVLALLERDWPGRRAAPEQRGKL